MTLRHVVTLLVMLMIAAMPLAGLSQGPPQQIPVPSPEELEEMGLTEEEYREMVRQQMEAARQGGMGGMETIESGMYTNDDLGYSVNVPDDWKGIFARGQLMGMPDGMDMRQAMIGGLTFSVTAQPLGPDMDWDGMTLDEAKSLTEERMAKANEQPGMNVELVSMEETEIAGKDGYKMIVAMTMEAPPQSGMENLNHRNVVYMVADPEKVFSLGYTMPKDQFGQHDGFIETHVSSFKLK
ncbi:hypothetical protein GF324_05440 [bacterium]|nr:hypothetical protein [bacterium]